jgi:hypothetical protein
MNPFKKLQEFARLIITCSVILVLAVYFEISKSTAATLETRPGFNTADKMKGMTITGEIKINGETQNEGAVGILEDTTFFEETRKADTLNKNSSDSGSTLELQYLNSLIEIFKDCFSNKYEIGNKNNGHNEGKEETKQDGTKDTKHSGKVDSKQGGKDDSKHHREDTSKKSKKDQDKSKTKRPDTKKKNHKN